MNGLEKRMPNHPLSLFLVTLAFVAGFVNMNMAIVIDYFEIMDYRFLKPGDIPCEAGRREGAAMKKQALGLAFTVLIAASAAAVLVAGRQGTAKAGGISHLEVKIDSREFRWQKVPGLTLKPGDLVYLHAEGKVKVYTDISGEYFAGPSGGAGKLKTSELQVRIGDFQSTFPGKNYVIRGGKKEGDLEIRFKDKKYSDNKGDFTVTVLHIPASMIPPVQKVAASSGGQDQKTGKGEEKQKGTEKGKEKPKGEEKKGDKKSKVIEDY